MVETSAPARLKSGIRWATERRPPRARAAGACAAGSDPSHPGSAASALGSLGSEPVQPPARFPYLLNHLTDMSQTYYSQ